MNSLNDIKWHSTIKAKMTSLLILTMTVLMAIAGFLSYNFLKNYETERLTTFANVSADRLAQSLQTPMWNIDRDQVNEMLDTEMAERTIVGVTVTDEGDKGTMASRQRSESGAVTSDGSAVAGDIRVQRNVVREGKTIGSLDIAVTQQYLREALKNLALGVVVLIAVLALAIFLLMNFLLNKIVINPLKGLADTADAISRGDLAQEFEITSKYEIGYVGETFKKMQLSLRIAMKRLTG